MSNINWNKKYQENLVKEFDKIVMEHNERPEYSTMLSALITLKKNNELIEKLIEQINKQSDEHKKSLEEAEKIYREQLKAIVKK